jgi:hypothetical protein
LSAVETGAVFFASKSTQRYRTHLSPSREFDGIFAAVADKPRTDIAGAFAPAGLHMTRLRALLSQPG